MSCIPIKYDDEMINEIIKLLETNGIITRLDCASIDLRPFGKGLVSELEKRGVENAGYTEGALDGHVDYSGVLFDTDLYTELEAKEYLIKNVLKSEWT